MVSRNLFSYSNRMLVSVFVSVALHGLLFCLPIGPLSKTIVPIPIATGPVSVRLVSLPAVRESSLESAPAREPSVREPDTPARPEPADSVERSPIPELPPIQKVSDSSEAKSVPADASASEPAATDAVEESIDTAESASDSTSVGPPGPRAVSFSEISEGLDLPIPEYPKMAKRWNLQGTVRLRIVIDPDGRIFSATVDRSSGQDVLDSACLRTVLKRWRFRPTGGERVVTEYDFNFKLE